MFSIESGSPETQISILALFALGTMVGVLGGFFGVGGGWIITPTLNILGMPMPHAVGTGLAYIMGMSLISVLKHASANAVEPALGLLMGGSMVVGIQAGTSTVMALEATGAADSVLRVMYIFMLFSLGAFMLNDCRVRRDPRRKKGDGYGDPARNAFARRFRLPPVLPLKKSGISASLWPVAVIGMAIGFFSGLLGAGGGFLIVPAMLYLVGTPTIIAVGTSLLCILISSPFGVAAYAFEGRVNFVAAFVMLLGVIIAAPLGVRAAHAVKSSWHRLLYAVMILCGGASVVLKELDSRIDSLLLNYSSKILIFVAGGGIIVCIMLLWHFSVRRNREERKSGQNSLE